MKEFKGFTLSEVLITLTVIGVVAAITLPPLIQNYQKQVLVNQLKKSYSTVSQAFQKMMTDDGVNDYRDTEFMKACKYSLNDACDSYIKKYFKTIKVIKYDGFPKYKKYVLKDGSCIGNCKPVEEMEHRISVVRDEASAYLNDGSILYITYYGAWDALTIDVNGIKGPNILGRDLFVFKIDYNALIGVDSVSDCEKTISEIRYDTTYSRCEKSSSWGAGRIMRDGWKMNY